MMIICLSVGGGEVKFKPAHSVLPENDTEHSHWTNSQSKRRKEQCLVVFALCEPQATSLQNRIGTTPQDTDAEGSGTQGQPR